MKKLTSVIIVLTILITSAQAQLKVLTDGSVDIQDYSTIPYMSGIRTTVHEPKGYGCAYNLRDQNGKDVFYVCAQGWLWTKQGNWYGSDSILKTNIQNIDSSLNKIKRLQGVQYTFKKDSMFDRYGNKVFLNTNDSGRVRLGLIAQEVEHVIPSIVRKMPNNTKAIAYDDLIALLIEGMKELNANVEELSSDLIQCCHAGGRTSGKPDTTATNPVSGSSSAIQNRLDKIEQTLQQCCFGTDNRNDASGNSSLNKPEDKPKLEQNQPNPFNAITKINYFLPQASNQAFICVYDLQGKQIRKYKIESKGWESITINGGELYPGIFIYNMIVDGNEIDSKKMLLID